MAMAGVCSPRFSPSTLSFRLGLPRRLYICSSLHLHLALFTMLATDDVYRTAASCCFCCFCLSLNRKLSFTFAFTICRLDSGDDFSKNFPPPLLSFRQNFFFLLLLRFSFASFRAFAPIVKLNLVKHCAILQSRINVDEKTTADYDLINWEADLRKIGEEKRKKKTQQNFRSIQ